MSLSIRRSIIEQFSFEGKTVRSFYIKGIGACLAACDVWRAEDDSNGRKPFKDMFQRNIECDMATSNLT